MRFSLILPVLLLAACASNQPNFVTMSEEELHAYNAEQPLMKKVYCSVRREASSWIPRRHCATIERLVHERANAMDRLYTLSPATGASVFGRNLD